MHKLVMVFCALIFTLFSQESYINQKLLETGAALFVEDEKVYLEPRCIIVENEGIFVKADENEYVLIPFLASSSKGCYTILDSTIYPIIKCKNCGLPFNPNFFNRGKCPRCGTQN